MRWTLFPAILLAGLAIAAEPEVHAEQVEKVQHDASPSTDGEQPLKHETPNADGEQELKHEDTPDHVRSLHLDPEIQDQCLSKVHPVAVGAKAVALGKPIMVLLMTQWCKACQGLRYAINVGERVRALLPHFACVYEEENMHWWAPTGQEEYVPQVHFFSSSGEALDIKGTSKEHTHFFATEEDLVSGMLRSLELFEPNGTRLADEFDTDLKSRMIELDEDDAVDAEDPLPKIKAKAAAAGKPLMVILITRWCEACMVLRGSINAGSAVRKLMPSFVVAYASNEDALHKWQDDGEQYVPQVHFYSPTGERLDVRGPHSFFWKFHFENDEQLAEAMKNALTHGPKAIEL